MKGFIKTTTILLGACLGLFLSPPAFALNPPINVWIVVAGDLHTCAMVNDSWHTVACWGHNTYGQLGDGTRISRPTPAYVQNLANVWFLAMGGSHSCAQMGDQTVRCWGHNGSGQLGNGGTEESLTPTPVSNLNNTIWGGLTAGEDHTCALLVNGIVKCWGNNNYGQLGDGTTAFRYNPTLVSGLTNLKQVVARMAHTCALTSDNNTVFCWGKNDSGQLGDGTTTNRLSPRQILSNVKSIAAGSYSTCSLMNNNTVKCWGSNYAGQLGDGTYTDHYIPQPVPVLSNVKSLAMGHLHSCALLNDGTVKCWGSDSNGQIGDGSAGGSRPSPTQVPGLSNAQWITAGDSHTCAVMADYTVRCWGNNEGFDDGYHAYIGGQVGDGTSGGNVLQPTQVVGLLWVTKAPPHFDSPKVDGGRNLDYCSQWGKDCGMPAADDFCQWQGYEVATDFEEALNIGFTKILRTGQTCTQSYCDGFKSIDCAE